MPQIDLPIATAKSAVDHEDWRAAVIPPVPGQWYSSPAARQPFQVIALTEESAQVKYIDNHCERIWLDEWSELDAELVVLQARVQTR